MWLTPSQDISSFPRPLVEERCEWRGRKRNGIFSYHTCLFVAHPFTKKYHLTSEETKVLITLWDDITWEVAFRGQLVSPLGQNPPLMVDPLGAQVFPPSHVWKEEIGKSKFSCASFPSLAVRTKFSLPKTPSPFPSPSQPLYSRTNWGANPGTFVISISFREERERMEREQEGEREMWKWHRISGFRALIEADANSVGEEEWAAMWHTASSRNK